ncbi:unnamed protein product [Didymodactylos carnosus]|uniref:Uncharacterized protein n=1 Tax=Didymodactylos carnosus TaxID=1234261 RepID=A0A815F212_9BILA|nr:unnamed protein product [Didymodactylos carnosus]CAF4153597.1 unnamed protein product [Didymodactylos carnosus]
MLPPHVISNPDPANSSNAIPVSLPAKTRQKQYSSVLSNKKGQLKIERLRSSVELIIEKHSISRTSIKYDLQDNSLKQHINNEANRYSFQITHLTVKNPNEKQQQLDDILMDEQMNSNLEGEGVSQEAYRDRDFDLAQGSHQTAYLYIDSILMIRRSQIRHLYPIDL